MRLYFWSGYVRGGRLTSHYFLHTKRFEPFWTCPLEGVYYNIFLYIIYIYRCFWSDFDSDMMASFSDEWNFGHLYEVAAWHSQPAPSLLQGSLKSPSRELTYPTLGKGKSSTHKWMSRGYVSSHEGTHFGGDETMLKSMAIFRGVSPEK